MRLVQAVLKTMGEDINTFKGRVQCFSMQVVINKCFLLNPEQIWRIFVLSFSRITQNRTL